MGDYVYKTLGPSIMNDPMSSPYVMEALFKSLDGFRLFISYLSLFYAILLSTTTPLSKYPLEANGASAGRKKLSKKVI